jgi:ABC-type antimicrobial peptide transport system permease subunit
LPPAVGEQIAGVPGVESSSVRSDKARVLGNTTSVTGLDEATIERFYRFRFSESALGAVQALGHGGAIVRKSFADTHHLDVGDPLRLLSPSGETLRLRVSGILDQGKFDLDPLLGTVMISQASFDRTFPRAADLYTFVSSPPVAPALVSQALAQGAERFPGVKISTRDEFVAGRSNGINQILNLLYVLLALSVVISLFGMVNTLVLAVFERTRELGMLRAIGLTRRHGDAGALRLRHRLQRASADAGRVRRRRGRRRNRRCRHARTACRPTRRPARPAPRVDVPTGRLRPQPPLRPSLARGAASGG